MQIERKIKQWGDFSLVIILSPDLLKYLDLKKEDTIILQDEEGKKGKFCSFWKKKGR